MEPGFDEDAYEPPLHTRIQGKLGGKVWGSNPYTYDSDLATAAVHAGLCRPGQPVTVSKRCSRAPGAATAASSSSSSLCFPGSSKNGVDSEGWDAPANCFFLEPFTSKDEGNGVLTRHGAGVRKRSRSESTSSLLDLPTAAFTDVIIQPKGPVKGRGGHRHQINSVPSQKLDLTQAPRAKRRRTKYRIIEALPAELWTVIIPFCDWASQCTLALAKRGIYSALFPTGCVWIRVEADKLGLIPTMFGDLFTNVLFERRFIEAPLIQGAPKKPARVVSFVCARANRSQLAASLDVPASASFTLFNLIYGIRQCDIFELTNFACQAQCHNYDCKLKAVLPSLESPFVSISSSSTSSAHAPLGSTPPDVQIVTQSTFLSRLAWPDELAVDCGSMGLFNFVSHTLPESVTVAVLCFSNDLFSLLAVRLTQNKIESQRFPFPVSPVDSHPLFGAIRQMRRILNQDLELCRWQPTQVNDREIWWNARADNNAMMLSILEFFNEWVISSGLARFLLPDPVTSAQKPITTKAIGLITDGFCDFMPWEHLPTFTGCPVVRMPTLLYAACGLHYLQPKLKALEAAGAVDPPREPKGRKGGHKMLPSTAPALQPIPNATNNNNIADKGANSIRFGYASRELEDLMDRYRVRRGFTAASVLNTINTMDQVRDFSLCFDECVPLAVLRGNITSQNPPNAVSDSFSSPAASVAPTFPFASETTLPLLGTTLLLYSNSLLNPLYYRTPAHELLISGSRCLLGSMWHMTGKELDRVAADILNTLWYDPLVSNRPNQDQPPAVALSQLMTKSRTSCRFPYLTGYGMVVYGLPF